MEPLQSSPQHHSGYKLLFRLSIQSAKQINTLQNVYTPIYLSNTNVQFLKIYAQMSCNMSSLASQYMLEPVFTALRHWKASLYLYNSTYIILSVFNLLYLMGDLKIQCNMQQREYTEKKRNETPVLLHICFPKFEFNCQMHLLYIVWHV